MHHGNHFYGHAHVLARYCGLDADNPPPVKGYLQHGWNIGDGYGSRIERIAGFASYVWSDRNRRRALATGQRDVVVTGSPWYYQLAMEPSALSSEVAQTAGLAGAHSSLGPAPREGTIWYPFHGWESQEVRGDHARLVDTIRAVEPGPVTICLYWHEHLNGRIRRRYERAGFRVICHGFRGRFHQGTDTNFLAKQLAELRRHRRVASNRLSTAVLYGASVGCEPAVYGDPMTLEEEDTAFGGLARAQRQWAALHGEAVDPVLAREMAWAELGGGQLSEPAALRELLGWPAPGETR